MKSKLAISLALIASIALSATSPAMADNKVVDGAKAVGRGIMWAPKKIGHGIAAGCKAMGNGVKKMFGK